MCLQSKMYLPKELIIEILSWLPAKSLLRFRSVSKSWLSLISDPYFTELHFERHSTQRTNNRILHIISTGVRSINLNSSLYDDSAVRKLDLPFFQSPFRAQIVGSCRGFLLLHDSSRKPYLWNPATGNFRRIPRSRRWIHVFLYGFCYDPSKDDYYIIHVSYKRVSFQLSTQIEIFSVKTNSWKDLEELHYPPYISYGRDPRAGLVLNRAIHWLVLRVDESDLAYRAIIAFDWAKGSLNEIPMPDALDYGCCDLRVLGGNLCLIDNGQGPTQIWVMGEYGVKSSWFKSMAVSCSTDVYPGRCFMPICLTEGGGVLGTDGQMGLVKCNENGEVIEDYEYCPDRDQRAATSIYAESLLSLPGDCGDCGEAEDT